MENVAHYWVPIPFNLLDRLQGIFSETPLQPGQVVKIQDRQYVVHKTSQVKVTAYPASSTLIFEANGRFVNDLTQVKGLLQMTGFNNRASFVSCYMKRCAIVDRSAWRYLYINHFNEISQIKL